MLFSSITFLFVFLPIVLAVYFLVPYRFKNLVMLIASLFFYAWGEPVYVILMILSICLNYVCGLDIAEKADDDRNNSSFLSVSAFSSRPSSFALYSSPFKMSVHTRPGRFNVTGCACSVSSTQRPGANPIFRLQNPVNVPIVFPFSTE